MHACLCFFGWQQETLTTAKTISVKTRARACVRRTGESRCGSSHPSEVCFVKRVHFQARTFIFRNRNTTLSLPSFSSYNTDAPFVHTLFFFFFLLLFFTPSLLASPIPLA